MKVVSTQTIPLFLKPNQVEKLLGISSKTLQEGVSEGIYEKGVHFYIPEGKQYAYWEAEALIKWMKATPKNDALVASILDDILKVS